MTTGRSSPLGPFSIDPMLEIVHNTRALLGNGSPKAGSRYVITAEWLLEIAEYMRQTFVATPWEGLSGDAFGIEGLALASCVDEIGAIDRRVARAIARQAAGVRQARTGLDAIATELCAAQIEAEARAASGDVLTSSLLEEAIAKDAMAKYHLVIEDLNTVTANQASEMDQLSDVLTDIPNHMLGGRYAAITADDGGMVSVTATELTYMAAAVAKSSTEVAAAGHAGPWLLDEVRWTHGWKLTETFNSALAMFEARHGELLATISREIELRATNLSSAALMYESIDAEGAEFFAASATTLE